jgi:hypothetical protein
VSTRLEAANNRIEALEKQLETNQRLQQNRYQDLQAQLHRLGGRLKRTILVAALTLVLVAVAAVILLR